jgi:hypothetical protein
MMTNDHIDDLVKRLRYEVTIERKIIVYAPSSEMAGNRVLTWIMCEIESMENIHISSIKELPPVETEGHGPIVDVAPSREARK